MYVCNLNYPACKAHASHYIFICGLSTKFLLHFLKSGKIFGNKLFNAKCMFWFSVLRLSETFLILRGRGDIFVNVHIDYLEAPVILVRV
jgi:hypothetical protein